ncbi:MAG TPA: hypothetical protein VNO52_19255 [Methylomirabilota bacterium]|nr:hypothetical protein [Methylomirabilota bacterium]
MKTPSGFRWSCLVLAWAVCTDPARTAESGGKPAPTLEGTWRWTFVMPDGTSVRPRLRLTVQDGQLTGKTSFRPGSEVPVTNLVVQGDQIAFQVIRQRAGDDVVTRYSGRWNESNIVGRIETEWTGEKQSFDWLAQRAHHGVEGVWRWTNSFFSGFRGGGSGGRGGGARGRGFDSRVELEQDGEKLTGKTLSRFGPSVTITNGVYTNGVVYFEIERVIFETRNLTRYHGVHNGDLIKGTMESEINGEERTIEWEATRVD